MILKAEVESKTLPDGTAPVALITAAGIETALSPDLIALYEKGQTRPFAVIDRPTWGRLSENAPVDGFWESSRTMARKATAPKEVEHGTQRNESENEPLTEFPYSSGDPGPEFD